MNTQKLDATLRIMLMKDLPELGELSREERTDLSFEARGEPVVVVSVRVQGELPEVEGFTVRSRVGDVVTGEVRLEALASLTALEEVLYVSASRSAKPLLHRTRRHFGPSVVDGLRIRGGADPWDGRSVTVGIIDLGIDLDHPAFREYPGGPTRVEFYWDRLLNPRPGDTAGPGGVGTLYTKAQINQHLLGPPSDPPVINPAAMDLNGHGSHVAGIAAGGGGTFRGMATGSPIIAVRTGGGELQQLPNIAAWVFSQVPGPCSINVSLGGNSGGHDGNSDGEVGLDALLRDPATGDPVPGRSIAVAAGNERVLGWHVKTTIERDGGPSSALLWRVPQGNAVADELAFFHSGLDRVQVRLRSPAAPGVGRVTHWVAADPLGCVEVAPPPPPAFPPAPDRLPPTAPGAAPVKQFLFPDGSQAFVTQEQLPANGDTRIGIRLEPPAGGGQTLAGLWLVEFRVDPGAAIQGDGTLHGYLLDDAAGADANTRFLARSFIGRDASVPPGGAVLHQDVAIPRGAARPVQVLVEYPLGTELECQVRPSRVWGLDPTEFVQHGNGSPALPGTLAHVGVVDGQVQFTPVGGAPPDIRIGHSVVAGRNRFHVTFAGAPPDGGISQIRLRAPAAAEPVPVRFFLEQDEGQGDRFSLFRGKPSSFPEERTVMAVYATPALPAQLRLGIPENRGNFGPRLSLTVPRDPVGNLARVRVRFPPQEASQDVDWRVTRWVGPGHAEVVGGDPGEFAALPPVGPPPAPRVYVDGDRRVTVDYPAPAAPGDPGVVEIGFEREVAGVFEPLRRGDWRVEVEGRPTVGARPIEVTADLLQQWDDILPDDLPGLAPGELDRGLFRTTEADAGPLSIPWEVGGHDRFGASMGVPDRIRLELLYPLSAGDVRVRVRRPDARDLGYEVGPGNRVHLDAGAAAPGGGGGEGAPVVTVASPGSSLSILHDSAEFAAVPGYRRVLLTLAGVNRGAHHLAGRWVTEVIDRGGGGNVEVIARLACDGFPARLLGLAAPSADGEEGSLSVPGSGREVLSVGNCLPDRGTPLPSGSSSAGPVRPASWSLVGGDRRRWLPYGKPDLTAPGDDIVAPAASSMGVSLSRNGVWSGLVIGDGSHRTMRATWPEVGGGLASTLALGPAPAEIQVPFLVPPESGNRARLTIRYPAGHNLAIRVSQSGGAAAPLHTHAVDSGGAVVVIPGPGFAPAADTQPSPEGVGRRFRMGDGTVVTIRQTGGGRASVDLLREPDLLLLAPEQRRLRGGEWRLSIRHGVAGQPAVPALTIESEPPPPSATAEVGPQPQGAAWPVWAASNRSRMELAFPPAAAPATPVLRAQAIRVPAGVTRPVVMDIFYEGGAVAPGAGNFRVLVRREGPPVQLTRSIDNAGGNHAEVAGAIAGVAIPGGRRFQFTGNNQVSIVHDAALRRFRITLDRNTAQEVTPGFWQIVLLNFDVAPHPQFRAWLSLHPFPHEAPFFLLPGGNLLDHTFLRRGRLAPGVQQEWEFHLPELRRQPLELEVVYQVTDRVQLSAVMPDGEHSGAVEAVPAVNTVVPGSQSGAFAAGVAGPDGVSYVRAGQVRVTIANGPHPFTSGNRRLGRIRIEPDGEGRIPAGVWRIRLQPVAVVAAGNGVCEAWFPEMLHQRLSGTSMASPHVAGVAALLLQQDHNQTQDDIRRRLLAAARPTALVTAGRRQLPGSWDPAAGWGVLNASEALLGHAGGLRHGGAGLPAAVGRTTGCPVACDDNCLIEAIGPAGSPTGLRQSRAAPHNRSPGSVGGDALPGCPRLEAYLERYHAPAQAFDGTGGDRFEVIRGTGLSGPLVRDRAGRGTLTGFRAVSWEEAVEAVAERLVEQWKDTGETLILPGRPQSGVVREVLFNRWVHHLRALLAATNRVSKCAFSTKHDISQLSPRVPYGSLFSRAIHEGLQAVAGEGALAHHRGDLSLTRHVVLWGFDPGAAAPGIMRQISALKERSGDRLQVLAVGPGFRNLPGFVRRITIVPGSDRDLALALMLRIVGNPGAAAPRNVPEEPWFADADRGVRRFVEALGHDFADFLTHVRAEAGAFLTVPGAGQDPIPDDELLNRCVHPRASTEAALAPFNQGFRADFAALYAAYRHGPTATVLGPAPAGSLEGEEQVQYLAALAFLSGNVGVAGGGITYGEDRHGAFNPQPFAAAHDSLRPHENTAGMGAREQQEEVNLASLGPDAPEQTRAMFWFDADPLTLLPDPERLEGLLSTTRLNVQVTSALDDSSRYADIVLPMADSLQAYDLQLTGRSPWINLTQPVRTPVDGGMRPMVRILHELHGAVRRRLAADFHDDLKPVIDGPTQRLGPVVLPGDRRSELADFFTAPARISDHLRNRLPGDEANHIQGQLSRWYAGLHGGEPTGETEEGFQVGNAVAFFNRVQVDWIVELLMARYGEPAVPLLLYNLLQRGTALDPAQFGNGRLGTGPEGATPRARDVYLGNRFFRLPGAAGFQPERTAYRNGIRQIDENPQGGRTDFPMRLVVADSPDFDPSRIPLDRQVAAGSARVPLVILNPSSPSIAGRGLSDGALVSVVGNVGYRPGEVFETVIARALVQVDPAMALETLLMVPGWHGLDRGGQRVARGVHTEEGEMPALFDNLVRVEDPGHAPVRSGPDGRGAPPPKR